MPDLPLFRRLLENGLFAELMEKAPQVWECYGELFSKQELMKMVETRKSRQ